MSRRGMPETLVYWTYEQTPHLASLINQLASGGWRCVWATEIGLTEERKKLGFHAPELINVESVHANNAKHVELMAKNSPESTLHIIHSFRGTKMNRIAFRTAIASGAHVAIVTENRNQPGWRSIPRSLAYRSDSRMVSRGVKWVFVNGYSGHRGGREFYTGLGWPEALLFPFGYFWSASDRVAIRPGDGPYRIAYVGQLIHRKGVDVLLRALSLIRGLDWQLELIGDGPDLPSLQKMSTELGLEGRVHFAGVSPLSDIPARIAGADVLVVPSRFDGWGMVVNEGLAAGLPVVCSDTCGAQDLLGDSFLGQTFRSEDALDLSEILGVRISSVRETQSEREARLKWYNEHATARVAAQYMIDAFANVFEDRPRPTPPWIGGKAI